MRSYAHDCLRMQGNHPHHRASTDLYKADRQAIADRRDQLARDLYLADLRFQMEGQRCPR